MDYFDEIIRVKKDINVLHSDLMSTKRDANTALCRQLCMYLINESGIYKVTEIGELFGRKHSTVIYSVRRIQELIKLKDKQVLKYLHLQ